MTFYSYNLCSYSTIGSYHRPIAVSCWVAAVVLVHAAANVGLDTNLDIERTYLASHMTCLLYDA